MGGTTAGRLSVAISNPISRPGTPPEDSRPSSVAAVAWSGSLARNPRIVAETALVGASLAYRPINLVDSYVVDGSP